MSTTEEVETAVVAATMEVGRDPPPLPPLPVSLEEDSKYFSKVGSGVMMMVADEAIPTEEEEDGNTSQMAPIPCAPPLNNQNEMLTESEISPSPIQALPTSVPLVKDVGDNPICKICQKGDDDGRSMIRFLPTPTQEEVILHVFCGRTAAILPNIDMPQYEILPKAGIKNKHGIGPDVNIALGRCRHVIVPASDDSGGQPKVYFLAKEFEEHLTLLRKDSGPSCSAAYRAVASTSTKPRHPTKASSKKIQKPKLRRAKTMVDSEGYTFVHDVQPVIDGKVRCRCGGSHWPTGTLKGAASWRAHIITKRHKQWIAKHC